MTTVSIEIDGNKVEARSDAMLIEAADEVGINIPRFCYHKKLSIAANCRMCLVEVEKAAKPLPACATPVTEGMKVFTRSPKALRAQKNVMEFLLINHPLDCPICDQGGECELQDVAVGYGKDVSRFSENKRVVPSKNIGPLIATDMTRCIHCTRCVRFGEEISGIRELGATGRGEHMQIGMYVEATVDSEMSGNVIDLCPVGALTSKPFRFSARAWEMSQLPSIAPHDCIGSNINVHVRGNKVMRVVPRENEEINETWISDRDRFGYEGIYHEDRLKTPMIKIEGQWQETDWNTAIEQVANGIKKIVAKNPDDLACLVSPSATVEEHYLAQKIVRNLGSNNIDHRLFQTDFSGQEHAPAFPALGLTLAQLANCEALLLVGSNVRKEQPIAAHRIRMATLQGAKIFCVNPADYGFSFDVSENEIVAEDQIMQSLAGIASAIISLTGYKVTADVTNLLQDCKPTALQIRIAQGLISVSQPAVIVGNYGNHHAQASSIHFMASLIARLVKGSYGTLTHGSNSAGAWLAGAIPHRGPAGTAVSSAGRSARDLALQPMTGYLLINNEPEHDSAYGDKLQENLASAEMVVALSSFMSASLNKCADVILPIATFGETSGTFVNVEGKWQSFNGAVPPLGESRPAWKVLRVLGNLLDLEGFDYITSQEVADDLQRQVTASKEKTETPWKCPESLIGATNEINNKPSPSMYQVDAIVRRAAALQATMDAGQSRIICNAQSQSDDINNKKAAGQLETA